MTGKENLRKPNRKCGQNRRLSTSQQLERSNSENPPAVGYTQIMSSAVCTLFEGNYHYGLGALANSLYARGFRGTIYAGYRGSLPPWVHGTRELQSFTEFSPVDGLTLRFIPLATKLHLTNYKPEFLMEVWEKHCPNAAALFYFDPDITVKGAWKFFEEWVEAGVGVCQDINPSMADNHPIRHAWRKSLQTRGLVFRNQFDNYFNAGFLGLSLRDKAFLADWRRVLGLIKECGADLQTLHGGDRSYQFTVPDQDALNIACMVTAQNVSPVGQDGMDFQHGGGGYIMSHAVGGAKPWRKKFVREWLVNSSSPSRADKLYFKNCEFPIRLYPASTLRMKWLSIITAAFLGRFVHRM